MVLLFIYLFYHFENPMVRVYFNDRVLDDFHNYLLIFYTKIVNDGIYPLYIYTMGAMKFKLVF